MRDLCPRPRLASGVGRWQSTGHNVDGSSPAIHVVQPLRDDRESSSGLANPPTPTARLGNGIAEQAFYTVSLWVIWRATQRRGGMAMAARKPSKAELSKAGKDLRNPRTPEKRETEAARTLRQGRKKP
jgi:hypothetical protein